jgi:hypothetical protein
MDRRAIACFPDDMRGIAHDRRIVELGERVVALEHAGEVALGWRQTGVFWAVFLSETSVGLFTLWLFTRGKWKTAKV